MSPEIIAVTITVLGALAGAVSWAIRESRHVAIQEVAPVKSIVNQHDAELVQLRQNQTDDVTALKRDIQHIKDTVEDIYDLVKDRK